MKVVRTEIPDVLLLEPQIFKDVRGAVFESHNRGAFAEVTGIDTEFVQDNQTHSKKNVLRGLHYQVSRPQGKLIQVLRGEIFDVALDLRRSSPTFRRHVSFRLSAAKPALAWIPAGFAHGFLSLDDSEVLYKLTDFRSPEHERVVAWTSAGIAWPLDGEPIVSERDRAGAALSDAECFT